MELLSNYLKTCNATFYSIFCDTVSFQVRVATRQKGGISELRIHGLRSVKSPRTLKFFFEHGDSESKKKFGCISGTFSLD